MAKSSEYVFGVSGLQAKQTFENISYPFPFADQKSTGIGWTGMKDSRPAPPGYIKDLIEKWKSNDDGKQWNENAGIVRSSTQNISKGINLLDKFIPETLKGLDVLQAWKNAGYFQYWGSIIANEIVNNVEGKTKRNKDEILNLIKNLKADYIHWAEYWMTPASAEINAGLIYDAIIYYFENNE